MPSMNQYVCHFNGLEIRKNPEIDYTYDYWQVATKIKNGTWDKISVVRQLCQEDLFFLIYFIFGVKIAHRKWVVERCREAQELMAGKEPLLILMAREHFKSTIWTRAAALQKILNNPEERIGIFAHSKGIAKGFLRAIKHVMENSELLKDCFPDILWGNPNIEAPKWSEDDGLIVKRNGFYSEATLEAWGLVDGMPTSKHFTQLIYDDIETQETVQTPEYMMKAKDAFFMSLNLGTEEGTRWVIGTPYHHEGTLETLKAQKTAEGKPLYKLQFHPATVDGLPNGAPVLLSPERLADLRSDPRTFYTQQLLNPTPKGTAKLDPNFLKEIYAKDIPKNLYDFVLIDPAGGSGSKRGDAWAIAQIGVKPFRDSLGLSEVYVKDLILSPMTEADAIKASVDMYIKGGFIRALAIEKAGMHSLEVHIANALRAKNRHISVESGNLILLRPGGTAKLERIERNLVWPLSNGKINISLSIAKPYIDRLKEEMNRFPYWHDDGLDILSYIYILISNYRFGAEPMAKDETKPKRDMWDRYFKKNNGKLERPWMVA